VFERLLKGENPGTHFIAKQGATRARKHWLKHTLKSDGQVLVDPGAVKAVSEKGASLLPSGILDVRGEFVAGASLEIVNAGSGEVIAKGICQYGHRDLQQIKGHKSDRINQLLGFCPSKVVIHRDDMVVLTKTAN